MIRWLLYAALGYGALYAVIWLHELGHAVLDHSFGCKERWLQVQVKPYLFYSTPGPVDAERYWALEPWKRTAAAYGGVGANLLWALAGGALLWAAGPAGEYLPFFLWMFVTLHLGEAVSYLFIGNIYLVSDMAIVAAECPRLRWPTLAAGAVLAGVYVLALWETPEGFRTFVAVWNVCAVASMCGGRIAFSLRQK